MNSTGALMFKHSLAYICVFPMLVILCFSGDLQDVSDLPIIEVPASGAASDKMAIIITGDGGWGVTDRGIAEALSAKGIPVIGLNSLKYFWKRKTPETAAADLNRIIQRYSVLWNRPSVVVIGYSFGADVLPFLLNRLPRERLQKVRLICFLGLSSTADFQFHWTDWIIGRARETALPVRPELEKLRGKDILCFYGKNDGSAICKNLDPGLAKTYVLDGGHRVGTGYGYIVDMVLRETGK